VISYKKNQSIYKGFFSIQTKLYWNHLTHPTSGQTFATFSEAHCLSAGRDSDPDQM